MNRQFIESMKRLYRNEKLDATKVIQLFQEGKITEEEKNYILDVKN